MNAHEQVRKRPASPARAVVTWLPHEHSIVCTNTRSDKLKKERQDEVLQCFFMMCFRHSNRGNKVCEISRRRLEIDVNSLVDKDPGTCEAKDVQLPCAANTWHAVIDNVPVINEDGKHFLTRVWMLNVHAEEPDLHKLAKIAKDNSEVLAFNAVQGSAAGPRGESRTVHREQEGERSSTRSSTDNSGSIDAQHTSKSRDSSAARTSNSHVPVRPPSTQASEGKGSRGGKGLLEPAELTGDAEEAASSLNRAEENPSNQTVTDPSNVAQADSSASSHEMQDMGKPDAADAEEAANDPLLKVLDDAIDEASSSENGSKEQPWKQTVTEPSKVAQEASDALLFFFSTFESNVEKAESTPNAEDPSFLNGAHSNLLSNHSMQPPG